MNRHARFWTASVFVAVAAAAAPFVALTVPNEVQLPGTQPGEAALESVSRCDNCHAGYAADPETEPAGGWQGSMMAHAARDPIFWATMAVAEQDFDGSGDLCLRCHLPNGWLAGRSVPTDGSAMQESDAEGVSCDICHQIVAPDELEHDGVQNAPFLAHDEGTTPEGYHGSGMYVITSGTEKLGPYADTVARHGFDQSQFLRRADACGTCHDVSNPVTGDLAHNNGSMQPLAPGSFDGNLGGPLADKAAFNNQPHAYGITERTFSEFKASAWEATRVRDYGLLPTELQDGAVQAAREAALLAGNDGDYEDGAPRFFTCQSCHMPPVVGEGCDKQDAPLRYDLPMHDLTGGNTWMPDAIQYLDAQGLLRIGGGLTAGQVTGLQQGKARARRQLELAAALEVVDDTLKVVNLTGHKLISGYPEGRRMWLHVEWYDQGGALLREDGEYGALNVVLAGQPLQVQTLLHPEDPDTRIYEAHMAMTTEWARQLLALGKDPGLPLSYDRLTGQPAATLGQLAALPDGSMLESFHFVLNNAVAFDNRIPPYGFRYDDALERNCLPVPATQFGGPGPGGIFQHWDEVVLDPPAGAVQATIELLYQSTSWEYIQFLYLANDGSVAFLAQEGANILDAWLNTSMAAPEVMATAEWNGGSPPSGPGNWRPGQQNGAPVPPRNLPNTGLPAGTFRNR